MICFYRYSDKGKDPRNYGYKESKKDCFLSFYKQFKKQKIILILDNCEKNCIDSFKEYNLEILLTNLGNSKSALYAMQYAVKNFEDESFYFAEDDYLYKDNSAQAIHEILKICDYASLYDHGDKYPNFNKSPNPLIKHIGEETILFRTKNFHWKLTNSTTMTFAVNSNILKDDINLMQKNLQSEIPQDFNLFLELNSKKRSLATCIPGLSTHLSPDKDNISPFFYD